MNASQRLSLPLLTVVLVGLPVWWAWPGQLSGWREFAIVAGWIGYGLVFASLVTMVREPRLARWLGGLERMYAWHHRLGIAAYLVLLLHPLALALALLPESPVLAWASLSPMQQSWPGWLGWASLLSMMAGLWIALSPKQPYARWRWLHGLLAASVMLGLLHLIVLGLENWLLWMPVLAIVVLVWRVLRADYGLAALPYVVTGVDRAAQSTVELSLRPMARRIDAAPGQFVLVAFFKGPQFHGCGEYHPFTLTAIAPDGGLRIGVKALGDCTRNIQTVGAGVAVRVQGGFGDFGIVDPGRRALWIAGGIGIAPFIAMLRAHSPTAPVDLLYFYRDEHEACFLEELQTLAASCPQLTVVPHGGGHALPNLAAILPDAAALAGVSCSLCGSPGLVKAAVALLRARGVAPEHIHFERFDFR